MLLETMASTSQHLRRFQQKEKLKSIFNNALRVILELNRVDMKAEKNNVINFYFCCHFRAKLKAFEFIVVSTTVNM